MCVFQIETGVDETFSCLVFPKSLLLVCHICLSCLEIVASVMLSQSSHDYSFEWFSGSSIDASRCEVDVGTTRTERTMYGCDFGRLCGWP